MIKNIGEAQKLQNLILLKLIILMIITFLSHCQINKCIQFWD